MKVLGIDPGLAITGYAILQERTANTRALERFHVLEAGVIRTEASTQTPLRLRAIYEDVAHLIEEFGPDAVAVEELFFNKNVTTAMAVSQARGVVLLASSELPIESFTPLQVKQQICGYGRATKPQMQTMVQRLLRLNALPKPDDAADAIAVALCYLMRKNSPIRNLAAVKGR
jgi:crossover junction endodeoxyribonuclease RuvC